MVVNDVVLDWEDEGSDIQSNSDIQAFVFASHCCTLQSPTVLETALHLLSNGK